MKRRNKWILIGCLACGIAVVGYLGYITVWAIRYLKSMEERRPILLYETDHRAILKACRELSRQVAIGKLEPGVYGLNPPRDPEARKFPQLILNLAPVRLEINKDGYVDLIMSSVTLYGCVRFLRTIRAHLPNYISLVTKYGE